MPARAATALVLAATALKVLLMPSYLSTDFDVHRNWLSITYALPMTEWYWNDVSEWTLDYPPAFAYFEWALAQVAGLLLPSKMLAVTPFPARYPEMILFQRLTVIATDLILAGGTLLICWSWSKRRTLELPFTRERCVLILGLVIFNPGLLMVDHVHFQYNGFLLGLLLVSIALIRMRYDLLAACAFASVLLFKHIFLYCAPIFAVYLFRHYCCYDGGANEDKDAAANDSFSQESVGEIGRDGSGNSDESDAKAHRRERGDDWLGSPAPISKCSPVRFVHLGALTLAIAAIAFAPIVCSPPPPPPLPSYLLRSARDEPPQGALSDPTRTPTPGAEMHSPSSSSFSPASSAPASAFPLAILTSCTQEGVMSQFGQILSRLFPWDRGIIHAYWAPNVWALYTAADKFAAKLWLHLLRRHASGTAAAADRRPLAANAAAARLRAYEASLEKASFTGGLVGSGDKHSLLPTPTPRMVALMTLLSMAPAITRTWHRPHPKAFLPAVVYCLLCSFMLGWHVHEKAVLMVLIPLTLSAADSARDAELYLFLSATAHLSLFPLLFTPREGPTRFLLSAVHLVVSYVCLHAFVSASQRRRRIRSDGIQFHAVSKILGYLMAAAFLYDTIAHPAISKGRMPFLPLMLYSITCALGMAWAWWLSYVQLTRKHVALRAFMPDSAFPES